MAHTITCQQCGTRFISHRASTQLPTFCSRRCAKLKPVLDRFWNKVEKTATCWLWTGSLTDGYGAFRPAKHRGMLAHRFSYELAHGPIPNGLEICHICDNPRCVRPDHLFAGSHDTNMKDAAAKGRIWRKGRERRAPITSATISRLRELSSTHTQAATAIDLGISPAYVSVLAKRHSIPWRRGHSSCMKNVNCPV